jgi:hypothetical protein
MLVTSGAHATVINPATAAGGYDGLLTIVDSPNASPSNSWYTDSLGGPGSDIHDQGVGTISTFLTGLGISGTLTNVTGMSASSLSGDTVTVTGTGADIFAIHFGGPGGGQELIFQFASLLTSFELTLGCPTTNKSCDGKFGLSNIYAFSDNPTVSNPPPATTPLPAALPLFAGGLGVIGLLARRRKQKT